MHLGRPVLTLAPEGALTRLARKHALGDVVKPRDEVAIADVLARRLRAFRDAPPGTNGVRAVAEGAAQYDRRALAGRFATVLRQAVSDANGRPAS